MGGWVGGHGHRRGQCRPTSPDAGEAEVHVGHGRQGRLVLGQLPELVVQPVDPRRRWRRRPGAWRCPGWRRGTPPRWRRGSRRSAGRWPRRPGRVSTGARPRRAAAPRPRSPPDRGIDDHQPATTAAATATRGQVAGDEVGVVLGQLLDPVREGRLSCPVRWRTRYPGPSRPAGRRAGPAGRRRSPSAVRPTRRVGRRSARQAGDGHQRDQSPIAGDGPVPGQDAVEGRAAKRRRRSRRAR